MDNQLFTIYHVSPAFNLPSIHVHGVDPDFSRGKRLVSWWVGEAKILWAGAHISMRYDISTAGLVVFRAEVEREILSRTTWHDVFTSARVIHPDEDNRFRLYLPLPPR